ncbi:MAG: NAD(P)-dependent oxidoreductase [Gemmataceae bacterium]|nr:NAD(P)-dependent oxidoreductase [Gemmataceae bacterium]MDW8263931.1 NAD(P)-dependent oxidoreductase [Gemmataceae bacterium]
MVRAKLLPDRIADVDELEERLSEPNELAIAAMGRLAGDVLVLGVGGKMGPTLARMVRRASDAAGVRRRVIGVSRFSAGGLEGRLQAQGVDTIRCDLLDPGQLRALPVVPNVIFMTGMKFGSTGQEARTWAMNCYLPGMVCEHFRHSRIVAFSTGNVYGLSPVSWGGSREDDPLQPLGDYAQSCVGRERIFEHFSRTLGIPLAILRLNYATELRYGVLVDLAQSVLAGQPIDVTMGHFNAIWQADANAAALAAFDHLASPPLVLNIAGPELLSVRRVAEEFGRLLGRPVVCRGQEAADALLSNAQRAHRLFGYPRVPVGQLMLWIADWLQRGGETLGKPTHFQVRDGQF